MSKVNVGVGDEFPVNEAREPSESAHPCAQYRARWAHAHADGEHGDHSGKLVAAGLGSVAFLSVAALAVMNPLITLAVTGSAAVAYGAGRMERRRNRWRRWRARLEEMGQDVSRPRNAASTDGPSSDKGTPKP